MICSKIFYKDEVLKSDFEFFNEGWIFDQLKDIFTQIFFLSGMYNGHEQTKIEISGIY
jgi:hypothetical protein